MSRFICVLLVFCSIVSADILIPTEKEMFIKKNPNLPSEWRWYITKEERSFAAEGYLYYRLKITDSLKAFPSSVPVNIVSKACALPIGGKTEMSRDTLDKKTEYSKKYFWLKQKTSGKIKTKTLEREAEKIILIEEITPYAKEGKMKYETWAILITVLIIFITFFIIIIMDEKKRANISCFTSAGATWAGLFIFFNLVLFIFNGRPELAFLSFILLVALLAFESICKSLLSTKIIIINTIMFIIIIAVSIGFAVYSVSAVFFIFLLAALTFGATYGIAKVIKKIQKRKDNI